MTVAVLIDVLGVVLVASAGAVIALLSARRRLAVRYRDGLSRWRRTRDHLRGDLGLVGAAVAVGAAGTAVTYATGWPLGRAASSLQSTVDWPVFRWFRAHDGAGGWSTIQDVLTQMGDRPEIKAIAVAAAIGLAVAWRRRWWAPLLVLAAAFVVEKYVQGGLGRVVARGHPPTTHGTYPSGGCARLVSMYGTILYLALRTWRPPRWVPPLLWTLLAEAAWLEGYARTFLLQHWLTDVVGGWIVGALLLGTFVLAAAALGGPRVASRRAVAVGRAQLPGTAAQPGST
jgi:membrane-associated phospholipid phosphatase